MFKLGLWGDPSHKSHSYLIILHHAQLHLQLPKQIVHPQVPDVERYNTKAGGGRQSLEVTKEPSPLPTFRT